MLKNTTETNMLPLNWRRLLKTAQEKTITEFMFTVNFDRENLNY